MRFRFGPALAMLLLLLALQASAVRAQDPADLVTATIVATEPELLAGARVEAFATWPLDGVHRATGITGTLDADGRCDLRLPKGTYVFEILHDTPDGVFILRSRWTDVFRDLRLAMGAGVPLPIGASLDGVPIDVLQLAIRGRGEVGEHVLVSQAGQLMPTLSVSPNERYRLRLVGRVGENDYVAVWLERRGSELSNLALQRSDLLSLAFDAREGELAQYGVQVFFPESLLAIDTITPETRVLTNRRYVEIGYGRTTPSGRVLFFHPQPYTLTAERVVRLGGELRPSAWATTAGELGEGDTRGLWRLTGGVLFLDPGGHELDLANSDATVTHELEEAGQEAEAPPPPEGFLSLRAPPKTGELADRYLMRITHDLAGEPTTLARRVETFRKFSSEHFSVTAPPSLEARARHWLAQAERAHRLMDTLSPYPPPRGVSVYWLVDEDGGRGGFRGEATGRKRGHIRVPLRGLLDTRGAFDIPASLVRPLQHASGYDAGDLMDRHARMYEAELEAFAWQIADTPEWVPEDR